MLVSKNARQQEQWVPTNLYNPSKSEGLWDREVSVQPAQSAFGEHVINTPGMSGTASGNDEWADKLDKLF
jgi:hypothetical protein